MVGADQIIVLDASRVAERGTHTELLAKGGLSAELWARQAAERELEEVAEGWAEIPLWVESGPNGSPHHCGR